MEFVTILQTKSESMNNINRIKLISIFPWPRKKNYRRRKNDLNIPSSIVHAFSGYPFLTVHPATPD